MSASYMDSKFDSHNPRNMSASDSHRAEVVEALIDEIGDQFNDGVPWDDEANKRVSDAIMALLDSEKQRWIGEVKSRLPKKRPGIQEYKDTDGEPYHTCLHCGGYDECDCEGFNEALDAVSKVLEGLDPK